MVKEHLGVEVLRQMLKLRKGAKLECGREPEDYRDEDAG